MSTNAQSFPNDTGVDLPFDAAAGSYRAITPVRLRDTRDVDSPDGHGAVVPNGYIDVDVTGREGIPLGSVGAVVLNVTAVTPTAAGYLTVEPSPGLGAAVSDVNFAKGQTVANAVVADVGDTGRLYVHNVSGGSTHVLVDAVGYFFRGESSTPGSYERAGPTRVLDTRNGTGAPRAAVAPGGRVRVRVTDPGGIDRTAAVSAVAVNVTATASTGAGYVTVWPDGTDRPVASTLNFTRGQTVPNLAVVPVGTDGYVDLYNGSAGPVQLLLDVRAYFLRGTPSANGTVVATTPTRVLDTRNGTGAPGRAVAPGATIRVPVGSEAGSKVLLNVTVTAPTGNGYITTWSGDGPRPVVSSLNFARGRTLANAVVVPVASDGTVSVFNGSAGTVHLVADRTGDILGADRSVADVSPADATVTLSADQVISGTRSADGTATVVLAAGVTPPAVGAGVVAPGTPTLPDGVAGRVFRVVTNPDSTSRVDTDPVSLDALYTDYDVSVNRSLQPSDIVGGGDAVLDAGTADFSCSGTDPTRSVQLTLDLSDLHVDVALDATRRAAHLQLSADPELLSRYSFAAGTACTLAPGAGGSSLALHIPVTTTPPVYVDVDPTVVLTTSGAASMDRRSVTHVAVGFDRGNGHDTDVHDLSGDAAGTAAGAATVDLGLFTRLTLAGRVGVSGSFGPSVTVADRGTGCSSLTGAVSANWVPSTGALFPSAFRPSSGRFAQIVLRGCDWDQFPLSVSPGRIGNAAVGDAAKALTAKVGVPLRRVDIGLCRHLETTDGRADVLTYLDGSGSRVTLLFAYRWVTVLGVRTGSTWAAIHAAYPATQLFHDATASFTYVDAPDGTSLRIRLDQGRATFVYAGSRASVRSIPSC
ncbi:hypothetical protein ACXR2U_09280 [Jatrophihabitans sp. YIM 134969]